MINVKKQLLSLLLSLAFIISLLPVAAFAVDAEVMSLSTSQFADMPNNWSTTALESAVANGLLTGSDGKIMPDNNLTRAQMAAIIVRAFGASVKGDISGFTDIASSSWYANSLAVAYKMGVIKGSDGKMNPDAAITREQAFVIIARALKLGTASSINKTFSDVGKISNWATGEVYALANGGYISGSNGYLNPSDLITRAEFAQLFYNIFKQYINTSGNFTSVSSGNLMINKPGVTLKDLSITGDLVVGDGVGNGEVILDNVKITGRLVIRGGGENSVIIKGSSSVTNVVVARVDGVVSVKVQGNADVDVIYIEDGSDDVNIQGTVGNVDVLAQDITVTATSASINNVSVSGANSIVVVGTGSTVQTLAVTSEASHVAVQVNGTVANVTTSAPSTQVSGAGIVTKVEAREGAVGASVVTPNTKIVVGSGVSGVTAGGGQSVGAGSTSTNNPGGTGIITPTPSGGGGSTTIAVSAITVTGTAKVGSALVATSTPTGATVSYQWKVSTDGTTYTDISGATTSTYTPVVGDFDKYIKVVATGTGSYTGTVTSAATSAVTAAALTGTATITGTAQEGQTLTAALTGGNNTGTLT
ncbi:MAG: hypothetical protein CVU91_01185, partial [Firmicutes bacterium HGW-Firmicutes-16]